MKKIRITEKLLKECLTKKEFEDFLGYKSLGFLPIGFVRDRIISFSEGGDYCDCASDDLGEFECNWEVVKIDKRLKLLVATLFTVINNSFITFSDSKRNNVIYKYMDGLKDYGFQIIEYPTSDGKSIIKRAYYINKKKK